MCGSKSFGIILLNVISNSNMYLQFLPGGNFSPQCKHSVHFKIKKSQPF